MEWFYWEEKKTVIGKLTVVRSDKGVCRVAFANEPLHSILKWVEQKCSGQISQDRGQTSPVFDQIEEYLTGKRKQFDLDLDFRGTSFQVAVWQYLTSIPYGFYVSYQDVANAVGNPQAARAVGQAVGANPVAILAPCHRVVGKNGRLTGFGGGLPLKKQLLALEGILPKEGENVEQWLLRRGFDHVTACLGSPSSKIVCRPDCTAAKRLLKGDNVPLVFHSKEDAFDLGYRPCKRCFVVY